MDLKIVQNLNKVTLRKKKKKNWKNKWHLKNIQLKKYIATEKMKIVT